VTEKAMQRIQREAISEVSLTRSPSHFVGVLRLARLHNARFHGGGMGDGRTWREGVLSLKHRRCNEANQYHPTQQSPHENDWLPRNENVHRRPPGTKSGSRLPILYCEKAQTFRGHLARAFSLKRCKREEEQLPERRVASHSQNCLVECPREPQSDAGFRCKPFKLFLSLQETLQSWPGSKLITTRRFTHKWQDDIPGITGLLGGGWSSVSQRRSTPLTRGHCLGRRATLYQGCPQIEPYPICAQQTDHGDRKTAQISPVHS
jgi:hypothetical protein